MILPPLIIHDGVEDHRLAAELMGKLCSRDTEVIDASSTKGRARLDAIERGLSKGTMIMGMPALVLGEPVFSKRINSISGGKPRWKRPQ